MPILSGKLREVVYGNGIGDKLAILVFRLISSFSYRVLGQRASSLNQKPILRRLLSQRTVKVDGVKYSLVDYESLSIVLPKFEEETWNYLKPEEGQVFIDIGAHIGKYSLQVAKRVGNKGLVVVIEPSPTNFKALRKGIQMNGFQNVIPLNIAAWKENMKLMMFAGDSSGHHTVKVDTGFSHFEVEARTIDSVVAELKIKRVDWVKIDVEGAEFEVLKGLKKTIRDKRPKIIVETFVKNLSDVEAFMKENNYLITRMEGVKLRGIGVGGLDFNYLFCEPLPI